MRSSSVSLESFRRDRVSCDAELCAPFRSETGSVPSLPALRDGNSARPVPVPELRVSTLPPPCGPFVPSVFVRNGSGDPLRSDELTELSRETQDLEGAAACVLL